MVDTLKQAILESIHDNNLPALMHEKTVIKIYACLAEGAIKPEEYDDLVASQSGNAMLNIVENRWEQLEASRQSLADAFEPLAATLAQREKTQRVAQLVGEGRTNAKANFSMNRELSAGRNDLSEWPHGLIVYLDRATQVRDAEMQVGLHERIGRGR